MVWTYRNVRQLRNKKKRGENISIAEIRKLEKYVHLKKKNNHLATGHWSTKQLLRAEELLQSLKKENEMLIQVDNQ